jgi:hypothetical protein
MKTNAANRVNTIRLIKFDRSCILSSTIKMWQERIQSLPTEIQILIGEYNLQHRKQTQQVKQEYFRMIYSVCRSCHAPFDKEFCPIDYFIIRKYALTCHWCSIDCFTQDEDNEEKLKCLTAIQDYTQNKSLLSKW